MDHCGAKSASNLKDVYSTSLEELAQLVAVRGSLFTKDGGAVAIDKTIRLCLITLCEVEAMSGNIVHLDDQSLEDVEKIVGMRTKFEKQGIALENAGHTDKHQRAEIFSKTMELSDEAIEHKINILRSYSAYGDKNSLTILHRFAKVQEVTGSTELLELLKIKFEEYYNFSVHVKTVSVIPNLDLET